jgi:RimJ/RimL family protein N-acetyltransferase
MPLEGDLVILREERREDLDFFRELRNDLDTQAWSKTLPPDFTEPMYTKRFEAREFSYDPKEGRFTIVRKDTGERAGYVSYTGLERRFAATMGIIIDKACWGTGIALDAQEVLLKFLFVELGLRVVRLWTHSGNPHAVRLAERSGFQVSGRMRESIFKGGECYDTLIMDLLREEYFARYPELSDHLSPL